MDIVSDINKDSAETRHISPTPALVIFLVSNFQLMDMTPSSMMPIFITKNRIHIEGLPHKLLSGAKYLVQRALAIIFLVLFCRSSTVTTPTVLPARRTLASISISSWCPNNPKFNNGLSFRLVTSIKCTAEPKLIK